MDKDLFNINYKNSHFVNYTGQDSFQAIANQATPLYSFTKEATQSFSIENADYLNYLTNPNRKPYQRGEDLPPQTIIKEILGYSDSDSLIRYLTTAKQTDTKVVKVNQIFTKHTRKGQWGDVQKYIADKNNIGIKEYRKDVQRAYDEAYKLCFGVENPKTNTKQKQ